MAQRPREEFFLSVITASELLHGVHRAVQPAVRAKRAAFVDAILDDFSLLPVELSTARAHARLWAELATAGMIIGPHDMWLAATCIAHGLSIVTANVREFARSRVWKSRCGAPRIDPVTGVDLCRSDCPRTGVPPTQAHRGAV
ncbi:MAG: type II toxin-antitoxin system VapC family toxin [Thermoanaerobaculia bacterium]|nr:type II toxin-antitoxin system VapC family toxin [Thermoanaerobaculia bacterium]